MNDFSKKRTTLVVFGANVISLDLITTLLNENSAVIVADQYDIRKQKLFSDLNKNRFFKYITLEGIPKLESVIKNIDYIFILLDHYLNGNQVISSDKYLQILQVVSNTLEYANSTETKVAITFPANIDMNIKVKKGYTLADLHRSVEKKINEILPVNQYVRIVYTGEIFGPGMTFSDNTPLKNILLDGVTDTKITIRGDGLTSYYVIYSADYIYGLVKANFSNKTKNLLLAINEQISELSFAYNIIEHNSEIKDIVFDKSTHNFKPMDILFDDVEKSIRFSLEELVEKTVNYAYETTGSKRQKKAKPLIVNKVNVEKIMPKEKLSLGGKIFIKLETFIKSGGKGIKDQCKRLSLSLVQITNNPIRLLVTTLILIVTGVIFYFFIFPLSSICLNSYKYYQNTKQYIVAIKHADQEALSYLTKIEKSNRSIQLAWPKLNWLKHIPNVRNVYYETDVLVQATAYLTDGLTDLNNVALPFADYLNKVELPDNFTVGTSIGSSREYSYELNEIVKNLKYIDSGTISIYKASELIEQFDSSILPENFQSQFLELRDFITENKKFIISISDIAKQFPDLVGQSERKRYIILLHNPYELRPHGGFISGFGILEMQHGQIKKLAFDNIYNLDGEIKNNNLFFNAPNDYTLVDNNTSTWTPSTINWEADYEDVLEHLKLMLKDMDYLPNIDGVISINAFFLKDLLEKTGDITINSVETPISSTNLLDQTINYHYDFRPGEDNKQDILAETALQLYRKLVKESTLSPLEFWNFTKDEFSKKNIIITLDNTIINNILSDNYYNSNLSAYLDSFFIYPLDWNASGNKVNAYITKAVSFDGVLTNNNLNGLLNIEYRNLSTNNQYPQGIYTNYLRIILPRNTVITTVSGVDGYNVVHESKYTEVLLLLTVAPQEITEIEIRFTYNDFDKDNFVLIDQSGLENCVYDIKTTENGTKITEKTGNLTKDVIFH